MTTPPATSSTPTTEAPKPEPLIGGAPAPVVDPNAPPAQPAVETPKVEEKPAAPEPLTLKDIVLPEGFAMDEGMATGAIAIISDEKLSPKERLQKLVDLQVSSVREASERGSNEWNTMMEGWQNAIRTDPEVGGAKFDTNLVAVNRLVDTFGTPALKEYLRDYGVGNHPEVFRLLSKIAPYVTEPTRVVQGGPVLLGNVPTKDNLYPN